MKAQSKTISFRNRIKRFLERRAAAKKSLQSATAIPAINNLYRISFVNDGRIQKNVVARYEGKSRSGIFFKFSLPGFFNSKGVKLNLICLDTIPQQIQLIKASLFTDLTKAA